ncbi:MAG: hypothetical protein HY763_16985 [Planctomycetes bacterium]|nr:hypothetical protein [Planctomycetota bacterium]
MSTGVRRWGVWLMGGGVLLAAPAREALACAVCFADPNSPLAKGATMGVWVLVGVVGTVLACIAGTSLFWIHRSRQLARLSGVDEGAAE